MTRSCWDSESSARSSVGAKLGSDDGGFVDDLTAASVLACEHTRPRLTHRSQSHFPLHFALAVLQARHANMGRRTCPFEPCGSWLCHFDMKFGGIRFFRDKLLLPDDIAYNVDFAFCSLPGVRNVGFLEGRLARMKFQFVSS